MKLEVLTIGGEILSGRIVDSNYAYLARRLGAIGLCPTWHCSTLDHAEQLHSALRLALDRADGVIVTGGLGATPDDITRPAIARIWDRALEFRAELWEQISARYAARGMKLLPISSNMARLPEGAEAIVNPEGVAPGVFLRDEGRFLIALPGVPREMQAMTESFVLPFLERELSTRGVRLARETVLRTAGVSETVLAERIEPPVGAEVAYLPHAGGVDLRLQRPLGSSLDDAAHARWVEEVRVALGPHVFGEGEVTLESTIGGALLAQGASLGIAESLTAGSVTSALVRVPGASRYLLGGVVAYANAAKSALLGVEPALLERCGAVSAECAAAMASGARRAFGATLGLSTTGIAG
ncbi:MAG: CinA family nicotinamide mononucleotide deamidase-related protein, partial [Candidatus Eisenbacteria bacterium]